MNIDARVLKRKKQKTSAKPPETQRAVPAQSAQDRFLTQMVEERRKVAVFLASGVKLEGEIVSFDQYVILMKGTMMDKVYKHAVSTIQPLEEGSAETDTGAKAATRRAPTIIRRVKPRLVKSAAGGK